MRYLHSTTSFLRRLVLLGWALAVVWIYLGNLVNFHQNRIWGKQLIPVACYSTRAKEKEGLFTVKGDTDSRLTIPGQHFDFSTPGQLVSSLPYCEFISTYFFLPDIPVIQQELEALSFRGPPAA
jgi:hypothetical protein